MKLLALTGKFVAPLNHKHYHNGKECEILEFNCHNDGETIVIDYTIDGRTCVHTKVFRR